MGQAVALETQTEIVPESGPETKIMVLLHEFGALDEAAIANALDLFSATVTRCLSLLYGRGLVRHINDRGQIKYESTGLWWPGEPSAILPLRGPDGRYTHA